MSTPQVRSSCFAIPSSCLAVLIDCIIFHCIRIKVICELRSQIAHVPNIRVRPGEKKVIGRNRSCRIKNKSCSRQHFRISLTDSSPQPKLTVEPISEIVQRINKYPEITLKDGELLKGPGFAYQVCFVQRYSDGHDESAKTKNTKRKADEMLDESDQRSSSNDVKHLKIHSTNLLPAMYEPSKVCDGWMSFENGSILMYRHRLSEIQTPVNRVVAFDFDGTLVNTKSGAKFAKNEYDWQLLSLSLPTEIRKLQLEGAAFVIFSNQNGIGSGRADASSIKSRFEQVCNKIDVPCCAILATEDDHNRKPRRGMWSLFVDQVNQRVAPNLNKSFYVGDALGRAKCAGRTADHSAADLLFAFNVGLPVLSPEQFLAGKRIGKTYNDPSEMSAFRLPKFVPATLKPKMNATKAGHLIVSKSEQKDFASYTLLVQHLLDFLNSSQNGGLVVLSGIPASGKSTFYRRYLAKNFDRIERDLIGSVAKCDVLLREKATTAKSRKEPVRICVDCTNTDVESRKHWLQIGQSLDLKVICLQMISNVDQCMHQETFRRVYRGPDPHPMQSTLKAVPIVALRTAQSRFQPLSIDEGFDAQYQLEFVPEFDNEQQKNEYFMFLKDK